MKRLSKHHILPPDAQEKIDKEAIHNIIDSYDIEIATHLLYIALKQINTYESRIADCVARAETAEIAEKEVIDTND